MTFEIPRNVTAAFGATGDCAMMEHNQPNADAGERRDPHEYEVVAPDTFKERAR